MTRRRSPLGFRTTDERFVPASEICEVFRDGDAVRVDLRGDSGTAAFFQFWTGNPAIAGTIVRLLPTTRTIEYEAAPADSAALPRPPLTLQRRRRSRRRFIQAALAVGLFAVAALLIADIVMRQSAQLTPHTVKVPVPVAVGPKPEPSPTTLVPEATAAEIASASAEVRRFDERMDGLRAQYRTASLALQWGQLSRDDFIDGINKWLVPQWRSLYSELTFNRPADGTLGSLVHGRLVSAALFWDLGLQDYAEGLKANNPDAVMAAFERMSNGNESRREAWRLLERAELSSAITPTSVQPHTSR